MKKATMGEQPVGGMIKRFRGIHAAIAQDVHGEYLEIIVPSGEIPDKLFDILKSVGMRESQQNEIADQIASFGCMNYLLDHQDR